MNFDLRLLEATILVVVVIVFVDIAFVALLLVPDHITFRWSLCSSKDAEGKQPLSVQSQLPCPAKLQFRLMLCCVEVVFCWNVGLKLQQIW